MTPKDQLINDLENLVTWLKSTPPDLPVPDHVNIHTFVDDLKPWLRLPGKARKDITNSYISLDHCFGKVKYSINVSRGSVCTRRPVGTRVIPATEERIEQVYEWDCPPSLLDMLKNTKESPE